MISMTSNTRCVLIAVVARRHHHCRRRCHPQHQDRRKENQNHKIVNSAVTKFQVNLIKYVSKTSC
ncbi:hypothetical protein E2C01_063539 [Portunus trituberculatus]|uniref:Uncharacterized protein n=1 Tax=Portunus trituberculatus TaxID=210409 RepID=A0A5B7HJ84_PORTR|nr:hypothetical protein [Portunus trituberculatus]